MTRFTLHVPELYNDGASIPPEYFAGPVESELLDIGGGFTLTHGIGAWRGDGTTYREPVRLYALDTDDPDAPSRLAGLARQVARDLEQEAVYVTAQEIAPQLVTAVTA